MEFEYECGTVTSVAGDVTHFVRVKNVKAVVTQTVAELKKVDQLIYLDNLKKTPFGYIFLQIRRVINLLSLFFK